jgi:hypothetical protein
MFRGLKIAVKQQKKLLVIFLFAIFLPSVSLSIFGIIALRNEKFRLAKQIENEQLQFASDIKQNYWKLRKGLKILLPIPLSGRRIFLS